MFARSIIEGLAMLGCWATWVAVVLYVIAYIAFLRKLEINITTKENLGMRGEGCLVRIIKYFAVHGTLIGLIIAFLLPFMIGDAESSFTPHPINLVIAMLVGILAVTIVTVVFIIPIVDDLIGNSSAVLTCLEGVIIFRIFLKLYIAERMLPLKTIQESLFPGFLAFIGYLIIARALEWGGAFVLIWILARTVGYREGHSMESFVTPVVHIFSFLVGLLGLFMYSSYVRLSIQRVLAG